jgi:putative DNA methylase
MKKVVAYKRVRYVAREARAHYDQGNRRAIDLESFPFEALSEIAELESWRKEVYRPIYHVHKWWAQRLGSVFRAIIIGAFADTNDDVLQMFYDRTRYPERVVFDPFMGSGTSVGEALKLGTRAIGRDINPVAVRSCKVGLQRHERDLLLDEFERIRKDVAPTLTPLYLAEDGSTVLYYFWVKHVPCPVCTSHVDLFPSYVFAQNAYAAKRPEAHAVCPGCGEINPVLYNATDAKCSGCRNRFDPQVGPSRGAKACCPSCRCEFSILDVVRKSGIPPVQRLYAKLILRGGGMKEYRRADAFDEKLYAKASKLLRGRADPFPIVAIEPGHNTNQALNYGYRQWHQFFNDRQLVALSILGERIQRIADPRVRDAFLCLFSGCLEFNNMFASYKGEGTGAVRHMFSHHILKPEKMPLEANLWGTPKSSGSFSTLFQSRLLRAIDYQNAPFELRVTKRGEKSAGEKITGLSEPFPSAAAATYREFVNGMPLYLSCGDSSATDIPDACVDAVVTDPPFFDNVHYSQLADFFHVWQQHFRPDKRPSLTTRSEREVQHADAETFADRLSAVWKEAARVLRPDGRLIFTYHHSRPEGWWSLLAALHSAGLRFTAAHPIKSEMSGAAPKQQAKEPIDLDIVFVCRRREVVDIDGVDTVDEVFREAFAVAKRQVKRMNAAGRKLSRNDVRIVVTAQVALRLSWRATLDAEARRLIKHERVESEIQSIHETQVLETRRVNAPRPTSKGQLTLLI